MELMLIVLMLAIVLGIATPLGRGNSIEEIWSEASFD